MLVILHHRNHEPPRWQAAAVEGVHKFRLGPRFAAEAQIGPPGLEIGHVAATADLHPLALAVFAGHPGFEIVLLSRGEAQVAGTHLHHPVRQLEPPAQIFGIGYDFLQVVVAVLRQGVVVHFHLFKLVDPLDAAHVPPGAHLLPAEAGGMGQVAKG